jgi:hypothetical protein
MSLQNTLIRRNKNYTLKSTKWLGGVANPVSGSYPAYTPFTNIGYRMSSFHDTATDTTNVSMGTNGWPIPSSFRLSVTLIPGGILLGPSIVWHGSFISTTQPTFLYPVYVTYSNWNSSTGLFTFDLTIPLEISTTSTGFSVGGQYIIASLGTRSNTTVYWTSLGWTASAATTLTGSTTPTVGDYFTATATDTGSALTAGSVGAASSWGNLELILSNVTNFSNFQLNTNQDGQSYVATQRYTQAFINLMTPLNHFRTLDWTGGNSSNAQINWSDRYWYNYDSRYTAGTVDGWQYSPDQSILFANANAANTVVAPNPLFDTSGGLGNCSWANSWESIITVANDFNKIAWIPIPPAVTTNYLERLAKLFANNIRVGVCLEFSNEVWNFGLPGYFATNTGFNTITGYIVPINYSSLIVTANLLTVVTKTPHGKVTGNTVAFVNLGVDGQTNLYNVVTCTKVDNYTLNVPLSSDISTTLVGAGTISIANGSSTATLSVGATFPSTGNNTTLLTTSAGVVIGVVAQGGYNSTTQAITLVSPYTGTSLTSVAYKTIKDISFYLTPLVSYSGATVNLVGGLTSPILSITTQILGHDNSQSAQRYAAWMLWCAVQAFKAAYATANNTNDIKGIYASQMSNRGYCDENLQWANINVSQLGPVNKWIHIVSCALYTGPWGQGSVNEQDAATAIADIIRPSAIATGHMTSGVITLTSNIPSTPFPPGTLVSDGGNGFTLTVSEVLSVSGNQYTTNYTGANLGTVTPVNFFFTGGESLETCLLTIPSMRQLSTLYNLEDVWLYEGGADVSFGYAAGTLPDQCLNYKGTTNLGTVLYDTIIGAYNSGVGKMSVTGLVNAGLFNGYGYQVFDDLTNTSTLQYSNGIIPAYSYLAQTPNYSGLFTGTINFGNYTGTIYNANKAGLPMQYWNTLFTMNGGGSTTPSVTYVSANSSLNAVLPFTIFILDNNQHSISFCIGYTGSTGNLDVYIDGTVQNRFTDGIHLGQITPQYGRDTGSNLTVLTTFTATLNFHSYRGFHVVSVVDNTGTINTLYLASAISN